MSRYLRQRNSYSFNSHSQDLLLLAILFVAAFLRFYHLDATSLWHDEGNTWALIQRSFGQIARDAAADIHPPGYYWLLKLWTSLFGTSAYTMRSLSAICGVLLVAVTYAIGKQAETRWRPLPFFALLAAWIVALNSFQIYYSQEARMYALLALESAGLFWALLAFSPAAPQPWGEQARSSTTGQSQASQSKPLPPPRLGAGRLSWPSHGSAIFLLCGVAGLWTHYLFPVVLAAAGISYVIIWLLAGRTAGRRDWRSLGYFLVLNLVIFLAYLPWLPTAVDRVLNWPKGGVSVSLGEGVRLTLQTLLFGPLAQLPSPAWPWLLAAALLPLLGIVALRRHRAVIALTLWLLTPIMLMSGLGLFNDSFLKFLLVASPAWCLLAAGMPHLAGGRKPTRVSLQALLAVGALAVAAMVLPAYFTDANARDNYAGVAAYIQAVGDPAEDVVLLNAPGQQEVWAYYDPGLPVLALPVTRPVDGVATVDALNAGIDGKQRVFVLFWATDESDPDKVVETWLDQSAYRGLESWQGNMRFVTYSVPEALDCTTVDASNSTFLDLFALEALCTESAELSVAAGDAIALGLHWRPLSEMQTRYKVSLQLLNGQGQVAAQHDGEPGGGSMPTTDWRPDTLVTDNHALWIPFGAPPGRYQLQLAVYDPVTGERLTTASGDAVTLGEVLVTRQTNPVPTAILPMQHQSETALGPVALAGYTLHRKGYAHAPETPVQPGDVVELVVWWQAPHSLLADWPDDATVTLELGDQERTLPLAGSGYPTAAWQAGELVRAVFEIPYDGSEDRLRLTIYGETLRLAPLPR